MTFIRFRVDFQPFYENGGISASYCKTATMKLYFTLFILALWSCSKSIAQDTLHAESVDIAYCIHTPGGDFLWIKNREELEEKVRNDASRERCLKELQSLDMNGFWLVGTRLITGWCHIPPGLKYDAIVNHGGKECTIHVSYITPSEPCRALGMYELWLRIPDLGEDYNVQLKVTEIDDESGF